MGSLLSRGVVFGVDDMTESSRRFYESTRVKMVTSLIYGALCLFCLGLTAVTGGRAAAARTTRNNPNILGDDAQYTVEVNGLGFATFCHFVGFTLALAAAFLISPYVHGTRKEAGLLYRPKEVDHGSAH